MENEQLVARIQAGEDVAENMLKLYNQNKGFLAKMAKRYQGYAELEDLMQEGYIGLSEAVSHFDANQGSSIYPLCCLLDPAGHEAVYRQLWQRDPSPSTCQRRGL